MTIICYRDGIMAADSAVFCGSICAGRFKKIARRQDGALAASAGHTGTCARFHEWFLTGDESDFDPLSDEQGFNAIIAYPDGRVEHMNFKGERFVSDADFHAIGASEDFAFGALAAGATAEQAVSLCIQYHDGAGGDVQVERLDKAAQIAEQRRAHLFAAVIFGEAAQASGAREAVNV